MPTLFAAFGWSVRAWPGRRGSCGSGHETQQMITSLSWTVDDRDWQRPFTFSDGDMLSYQSTRLYIHTDQFTRFGTVPSVIMTR